MRPTICFHFSLLKIGFFSSIFNYFCHSNIANKFLQVLNSHVHQELLLTQALHQTAEVSYHNVYSVFEVICHHMGQRVSFLWCSCRVEFNVIMLALKLAWDSWFNVTIAKGHPLFERILLLDGKGSQDHIPLTH